ncbi:hypothetical protein SAMN05192551_103129 [Tindallia magadiensis]|uniref:Sulfotransferase family protein n=1 Tax=Tindallia magadiensis TaxID=69895 RepID=A0A1I3D335_9FIRM|nr:hypothetical protein [Tindallia magadiensis]SFH81115.1 hypothetical protein SAMN05192551_103129 [Tindallia magadiensis]
MSIKPLYFEYMHHLGKTVTVDEFQQRSEEKDLISLRHDIDYNLDLALEMSFWEKENNLKATYYMLHSADYWDDPKFLEKCLQIQDFGHEIGLHLNILAEWQKGITDNPQKRLQDMLNVMRQAGLKITGTASHGDKLCYEHQFINYWCFQELRPENPVLYENNRSAEGIFVQDKKFHIKYPDSHQMTRTDGSTLDLWSVSMKDLELTYDASHVSQDHYFTDSGGKWTRSPDPLHKDLSSGRHQVLIHPEYWQDDQKIFFFLSTARSGSKWLANQLEKASSVKATHEFTLNHHYEEENLVHEKQTAVGFVKLMEDRNRVEKLMKDSRAYIENLKTDYAEANVYLERLIPSLNVIFPDATIVHLHRKPKEVVRSIMNREWYDLPEDTRHPQMPVKNWDQMTPFEKCCWYVRKTNETLMMHSHDRIVFEKMVTDQHYLMNCLKRLGIASYPRLMEPSYDKKINENTKNSFPEYKQWTTMQKAIFNAICNPIRYELGYKRYTLVNQIKTYYANKMYAKHKQQQTQKNSRKIEKKENLFCIDYTKPFKGSFTLHECEAEPTPEGVVLQPTGEGHAYFLPGGGNWSKITKEEGWPMEVAHHYRGVLHATLQPSDKFSLFVLMYGEDHKLLEKIPLGQMNNHILPHTFAFKSKVKAVRFNVAIYMPVTALPEKITIQRIEMQKVMKHKKYYGYK